jgi:hypothetical protein
MYWVCVCPWVRTPSSPVRERERDEEREGGRDRVRKRERERCRICPEIRIVIFIFKMNDGCLGTF